MNRLLKLNLTFWGRVFFICSVALGGVLLGCKREGAAGEDQFTRLTNRGKSELEAGNTAKAVELFRQAAQLNPTLLEARLNLANAYLRANQPEEANRQAEKVLEADHNSAAAYYLIGCASLRLGKNEEALRALEQSQKLDPAVTALNFQLALAQERLGHINEAIEQLQTVVQFEPEHPGAHYRLSQLLLRAGRQAEGMAELAKHQEILAKQRNPVNDLALLERCKHTAIKLPFKLEEPERAGLNITFVDATVTAFSNANSCSGPLAVIDIAHDGRNSIVSREGDSFRLWLNQGGRFVAQPNPLPALPGATYRRALVGDLQNDQTEDVVLLSDKGCQVLKFTTNGVMTDGSRSAGFSSVPVLDGQLLDFDYTGKLGFIALQPDGKGVRTFRNLSSAFAMYFSETGVTSGLPAALPGGQQLVLEDWNNDELMDIAITRDNQPPLVHMRERGGPFVRTNLGEAFPASALLVTGDLNNDSWPDVIGVSQANIDIVFGGGKPALHLPLGGFAVSRLVLWDYDNDGWLDLLAAGHGLRVWRNLGSAGFIDVSQKLGLDQLIKGKVQDLVTADFDGDCDTDLIVASEGSGLHLLRNEGGSNHHQLKLRLIGHRSNASGLGVRYEISAGGLRNWRTARQLPIEAGLGRHARVDSVAIRWFDGYINNDDIDVSQCRLLALDEIEKPTGSCPYLYAWDGHRFRFVTDLLGAAPLGLPISNTRVIDADPSEFVYLGNETHFPPRAGHLVVQITEELREVLYLDEAKLVVVDRPVECEVHPTSKLMPGKPFPAHELAALSRRHRLLKATDDAGSDVTARLDAVDEQMVSPRRLRAPQLRGLAEPYSVTLDFGRLPPEQPLVLALTGWLRFGGGMANIAAAHTPDLPFPFPILEVETAQGWQRVDVTVGAPAGKTKTILVDLTGKLPGESKRLRLSTAFEIHWDRIALFEKQLNSGMRLARLAPAHSDLHWRGYSQFETRPWDQPLTPDYSRVKQTADWTITPSGWCTRYGTVDELIVAQDNALALLNGGDELTLSFPVTALPPKPPGTVREFFLYTVGWDKDADFHCTRGWEVEPLPWHGMDDQLYGRQTRPAFANDDWLRQYNTRWVGPYTLISKNGKR